MHAFLFPLISLPLLAAAAPAQPSGLATGLANPGAPPPQPTHGTVGVLANPTYCAKGTGPDPTKDRAFFAGVDSVLSKIAPAFDTPLDGTFPITLPNNTMPSYLVHPTFTFHNEEESNPDLCVNTVRPQMYKDIDGGATGGEWHASVGANKCRATMVIDIRPMLYEGGPHSAGVPQPVEDACHY